MHGQSGHQRPTREEVRRALFAIYYGGIWRDSMTEEEILNYHMRRLFPEPEPVDPFKPDPSLTLSNEGPTQDDLRAALHPPPLLARLWRVATVA